MKLTAHQQKIVEARGKDIIVSAGAGTGKTRVLVERVIDFIQKGEAVMGEILAITFTDKAANEMKSRLYERLNELGLESEKRQLESAYISTIHAFASRLLKDHPLEAGVDPDFRVLEPVEAMFLKEKIIEDVFERLCQKSEPSFELLKNYGREPVIEGIFDIYKTAKQQGVSVEMFFEQQISQDTELTPGVYLDELGQVDLEKQWQKFSSQEDWNWSVVCDFKAWYKPFSRKGNKETRTKWKELVAACENVLFGKLEKLSMGQRDLFKNLACVFEQAYEEEKKKQGLLDFDDLQLKAFQLLTKESSVCLRIRNYYQQKFKQVLVDEFQDTNYLQMQFIETLSHEQNLFFVGDYKQSIYRFRGAEPDLFLKKTQAYKEAETCASISLVENFRTHPTTLEIINQAFFQLWEEDSFSFEPLIASYPGGEKSEDDGLDPSVEIRTMTLEEGESLDEGRLKEAELIAKRMLELNQQGTPFGDMVVLFEAMTSIAIYEQALKKYGVPYYALSGRGYYHQPEVRDMISLLTFLDNFRSDIALAAVLRSPLFQISDDTLFWLAHQDEKGDIESCYYDKLKRYEDVDEIPEEESTKISFFLQVIEKLFRFKDQMKLVDFLDLILQETSYDLTMLADMQGVRRYANLKKMINLAREQEKKESLSLSRFIRLLRRMGTQEIRESEAQVEAEQSGAVVRLSTIHRAKGLEYPVVFVADMGREKRVESAGLFTAEAQLGFGMKVWNPVELQWEETQSYREITRQRITKDREESKRRFYVAATRAEKRLVLSGVSREKSTVKESFYDMRSWMEWINVLHLEDAQYSEEVATNVFFKQPVWGKEQVMQKFEANFSDLVPQDDLREALDHQGDEIMKLAEQPKVSFARIIDLPVSAYVAFLKDPAIYFEVYELENRQEHIPQEETRKQQTEEDQTAADFGTTMHLVLEKIDFQNIEGWEAVVERCFRGYPGDQVQEAMNIVKQFLQSPVFERLKNAKVIKKELPFLLNERHGILHGIIDVLFQDPEDVWHVLDYKTAVGNAGKVKDSGYHHQIQIYGYAVSQLLGVAPKSGVVYFLKNQHTEVFDLDGDVLSETGDLIRDVQEKMMAYRYQSMSKESAST